jgi:cytidylate kinase
MIDHRKKRATIGGKIATGTSSVLRELKARLGSKWNVYSTGDAMRKLADSHGREFYEFLFNPPKDIDIDQIIDDTAREWLKEDCVIVDSRCAHGYAPRDKTLTILLDASDEVRFSRYFNREKKKNPELTEIDAQNAMNKRDALDIDRFKKATGTDEYIYDPKHFDVIFNSGELSVESIVNKIIDLLDTD